MQRLGHYSQICQNIFLFRLTPKWTDVQIISIKSLSYKSNWNNLCESCPKWRSNFTPAFYSRAPTWFSNIHLVNQQNFAYSTPRQSMGKQSSVSKSSRSTLYYVIAIGVLTVGLSYAAVPLYRIFCQAYSYGGTIQQDAAGVKVENMKKVDNRVITIKFNADTAASMTWNFRPQQSEIMVLPGETALAFYTAKNPMDHPVVGISTYNVIPFDAGQYFNKIQCFCFEEQLLNPKEEVHMPVFFYIDPEFVEDPKMENVDLITLSYTFFESKEGMSLPLPGFMKR